MPLLYRLRRSVSSDRAQLRCASQQQQQQQQRKPRHQLQDNASQKFQTAIPTCQWSQESQVRTFAHAPKDHRRDLEAQQLQHEQTCPQTYSATASALKRGVSLSGISAMMSQSASMGTLRQQQAKPPQPPPIPQTAGDTRDLVSAVQRNDLTAVTHMLATAASGCQQRRYLLGATKARKVNIINQQLRNGMSALHQAAFTGNPQVLHVLLEHGGRVDLLDCRGLSPLHVASYQGHFDCVHLLLKWNSSINAAAAGGQTPLHLACQGGHYDVVKLLLCNNADPMLRTEDGRTAFDAACEFGHFSIAQLLMSMKTVTGLLYEDCHLFSGSAGTASIPASCLHLSARNGHTDVLRLLLSQPGVNINRLTQQGSCLHLAVANGHLDTARLLLEQGIDPTLQNTAGQTARDFITRDTPHARELDQMLSERLSAVEAIATRDFCDLADPHSIAFRCGERLTVLERAGEIWKGFVTTQGMSMAGYFPASAVQLLAARHQADEPQQQHQQQQQLPQQTQRPMISPPSSILSSTGIYQYHQQPHPAAGHSEGLVACSIPQPPTIALPSSTQSSTTMAVSDSSTASVGSSSPPGIVSGSGGNRNSAASLDSGRSSSHTATSCDSRVAFALPPSTSCNAARLTVSGTLTASSGASACSVATAAGGCLGPRQSIVSTCSSGSLGSLPDDGASSVSSTGDQGGHLSEPPPQYHPEDWVRAGLSNDQQLTKFLNACQFGLYKENFWEAGYDIATLIRCTPEDLNAVGLTDPRHRKRLKQELGRLAYQIRTSGLPDPIEDAASCARPVDDVAEFCRHLGLPETLAACLRAQGFAMVQHLANMAWEDLEEIGISKLGHQKKLMLAIDRFKRLRGMQQQQQQQQQQQSGCRHTVSCGTCTATDVIIHPMPPSCSVQPSRTDTAQPSQTGSQHSLPPQSPHRSNKPVAKVLGQSSNSSGTMDAVQQQPPPLPHKVPPPPPKRVTSMLRHGSSSRDPSPMQPHQARCGAYENAGQIENALKQHQLYQIRRPPHQAQSATASVVNPVTGVSSCSRSNSTASVASIPFANENCGTIIRHKQQNQQQQQKQLSPEATKRLPSIGGYHGNPPAGASSLLTPPTSLSAAGDNSSAASDNEDAFSNLDDICDMLSDLQSMLDKELRDQKPLASS